ncbi:phage-like protein [Yersinia enterocolitica]|uniref:morphogenetic protein n=1 Tax=Yersinia enterocolitica TaxID=630 RepID=UPI0005E56F85|nr:morphogenetic protein [Yersinia enterocolitica]CNL30274.1 phage-like protein [Yersinia enterocolitica]
MNEKPILFNAEMVNAILSGRKTQTRRIMKVQPQVTERRLRELGAWQDGFNLSQQVNAAFQAGFIDVSCPLGKPGDQLWVRETWNKHGGLLTYRADHDWIEEMRKATVCPAKWVPSIHMPRWASRINLLITGVRVERLQDISQEDAQAEGMELTGWRPTYSDPDSGGEYETPYDNFAELWISIYGEESWQANPWVWVINFERMEAK